MCACSVAVHAALRQRRHNRRCTMVATGATRCGRNELLHLVSRSSLPGLFALMPRGHAQVCSAAQRNNANTCLYRGAVSPNGAEHGCKDAPTCPAQTVGNNEEELVGVSWRLEHLQVDLDVRTEAPRCPRLGLRCDAIMCGAGGERRC